MKGFIYGTTFIGKEKVAVAVDKIISVTEEKVMDSKAFVELYRDRRGLKGILLNESYDEIISQLKQL